MLIERKELTSGSTWHAAGLLPLFNMSYSVGQIHKYSVKFYQELQQETGMNVGFSQVSNIRLARTKDRWDEYMYYAGIAETIGIKVNILTPEQVKEIWPLCETEGCSAPIQHPDDGYIQPADLTQALAKGARDRGATIYRNTTVTAIEQLDNGLWKITTDKGEITAEHVISCTGNFARKTGEMVGINIPSSRSSTSYIVTEPHPAILERKAKGLPEMGRAARERQRLVHARGKMAACCSAPTRRRTGLLRQGPVRRRASTNSSRKTSTADAAYRERHRARAGLRRSRHQEGL